MRSWFSGSYETFPVSSSFSSPPIRCSSPGVPGIAHGRASVSASRLYGRNPLSSFGVGRECRRDVGEGVDVRDQPRLGAVRKVRVGEQEDRRAVLHRYPRRLDRRVEAPRRRRGRDDGHGRLGVPAEQHHEQIGLLGLRRHARRRAGPLNIDDEQGQFERDSEPHGLRLQHDSRPSRGRDAESTTERSTERRSGCGDLVLRLKRTDAEVLQLGELLENVGRRRYGVGAEKQRKPGQLARSDESIGESRIPRHLSIRPRLDLRRRDLVRAREILRRLAVVPPGLERLRVRLGDLRALRELLLDEPERAFDRPVVEPRHEAQSEEVLRSLGLARRDSFDALEGLDRHGRKRNGMHVEVGERAVVEWIRLVACFLQISVVEGVGVGDERPALREIAEIDLQRGRVHRNENAGLIAGRQDVVVGEVHLEPGHAGKRAGRCADLGREVGERREVVAEDGRLAREAITRELHPVAGVAGEPDHDPFEVLDGLARSHSRGIAERSGRAGSSCAPAAKRPLQGSSRKLGSARADSARCGKLSSAGRRYGRGSGRTTRARCERDRPGTP